MTKRAVYYRPVIATREKLVSPAEYVTYVENVPTKFGPELLVPEEVLDYFRKCPGGYPEQPLIEWAGQFLHERSVFVDVGAHCGTWCLTLAPRCQSVQAFEPQRENYSLLRAGVMLNGLDSKIRTHRFALSDDYGDGTLRIRSADGGGSSIKVLRDPQPIINEERIRTNTLDRLLGREPRIDLIKIDAEGSELDVIRGARATITASRYPPIVFEAWGAEWYRDQRQYLFDYLGSLGYRVEPINMYGEMFLATHPIRSK